MDIIAGMDRLITLWESEIDHVKNESRHADVDDKDALFHYRQGVELALSGLKKLRRLAAEDA